MEKSITEGNEMTNEQFDKVLLLIQFLIDKTVKDEADREELKRLVEEVRLNKK